MNAGSISVAGDSRGSVAAQFADVKGGMKAQRGRKLERIGVT
ncbi:hypothetical protein PC122_g23314 [Phytophthora cactorum]|nr:hypothetical protein PC122_g23314 [Phytophthora cactorum]